MSPDRPPAGAAVRAAAAIALARVVTAAAPLDAALAEPDVAPRDRPLLKALVQGALRWHQRLEWQAGELTTRQLKREQAELAALLRIGLYQLQESRIPPHAAVSATVDAAALLGVPRAKGLVNAVLRRFMREREALDLRMQSVPRALFSHPPWLIDALRRDWPNDWRRVLEQNNCPPPMWLRVNLLRTSREEYLQELATAGIAAVPAADVPSAVLLAEPASTDELPGFAAGRVSVQDAAAQLAPSLLEPEPGQRVLDACAAPGGKTGHLLEACPALDELVALDRDPLRLERVRENLTRLELDAKLLAADATAPGEWWDGRAFDRILLDAPCSAVGVIRRHPDIKVLRKPGDVDRAAALQAKLLDALWPLLAPGGRLLYATCSVLARENSAQIEQFLARAPDAALVRTHSVLPGQTNMDGFYYACVVKQDVARLALHPQQ